MRHHDRWVAGTLLILFTVVIAIFLSQQQAAKLRSEMDAQQAYGESLLQQYSDLVEENAALREQITLLDVNLTTSRSEAAVCRELLPPKEYLPRQQRISLDDIRFSENAATINVDDIVPGIIAPSSSMAPFLTEKNIVLETTPTSAAQILLGDIIIYERGEDRIIHRVVRVGWDAEGWFAITRGDNNRQEDPEKVRFAQVRGILVAIIY